MLEHNRGKFASNSINTLDEAYNRGVGEVLSLVKEGKAALIPLKQIPLYERGVKEELLPVLKALIARYKVGKNVEAAPLKTMLPFLQTGDLSTLPRKVLRTASNFMGNSGNIFDDARRKVKRSGDASVWKNVLSTMDQQV